MDMSSSEMKDDTLTEHISGGTVASAGRTDGADQQTAAKGILFQK